MFEKKLWISDSCNSFLSSFTGHSHFNSVFFYFDLRFVFFLRARPFLLLHFNLYFQTTFQIIRWKWEIFTFSLTSLCNEYERTKEIGSERTISMNELFIFFLFCLSLISMEIMPILFLSCLWSYFAQVF